LDSTQETATNEMEDCSFLQRENPELQMSQMGQSLPIDPNAYVGFDQQRTWAEL
jgi:hypothetical protein